MNQMIAVQISRPGAAFETVKRDIPEPGRSHVRIKVQACGVCHSDVFVKEGHWPGLEYPRITGHEVAGVIDEIGSEVIAWKKGQRVGVGWHGAHCGVCVPCRRGDFISCQNLRITGFNNDGGYAQYMIARADVLALIPEALSPVEAAPILCAGITTFNSLRHSGAVAGDLVAVLGLGGLGHLGIQYSKAAGFETIAVTHSKDKEELAYKLGAHSVVTNGEGLLKEKGHYGNGSPDGNSGQGGGADVILATSNSYKATADAIKGIRPDGRVILMGFSTTETLTVSPEILFKRARIIGSTQNDREHLYEALDYVAMGKVKVMTEIFPLQEISNAYDKVANGNVRFKAVIKPTK